MNLHITTADGVPIYLQIVQQLKYLIAAERLQPGEALPPIRSLAEDLLVNPNTVARAYRELETLGLVASKQGSGTRVSANGSPLARAEKRRILTDRIDTLLAEARQLGIGLDETAKLLRDRAKKMGKVKEAGE
jgi:GntR family transcriptional regulator